MIPVLGFATVRRFDLADRLLESINYPVEELVIIDNSGLGSWEPVKPPKVKRMTVMRPPYGLGLVGAWNLIVKSTPYAPYWVLVNDDCVFDSDALQVIAEQANPEGLGHPQVSPRWAAIVLGEGIVDQVGLYDERFYPLYFDDNDFERRIEAAHGLVYDIPAVIHHDNSASINHTHNDRTYKNNHSLFFNKVVDNDNSWSWSLESRRRNRWD